MSGLKSRNKGRKGQREARLLLESRDYMVVELNSGTAVEDMLMIDLDGVTWAVEVKNTKSITVEQRKQAMEQAKNRKARWMLMSKIDGTSCWLIQRQGFRPVIWDEK
jgi:Holliday junction resolvase-like predicted endonuclease